MSHEPPTKWRDGIGAVSPFAANGKAPTSSQSHCVQLLFRSTVRQTENLDSELGAKRAGPMLKVREKLHLSSG